MTITSDLAEIYDAEAEKYAMTRRKPRHEAKEIFERILRHAGFSSKWRGGKYKILELGCGSGRFVEQKEFSELKNIDYTGVDVSKELLKFAKESYKKGKFICDDMLSYTKTQKQESLDAIVAFASFQHIPTKEEREVLMHYFYQNLKYGGILIMTNRAMSSRFRKKYKKQIIKAMLNFIFSAGKKDFRDVMVPRKSKDKTFERFYHLFSIKELDNLCYQAGFVIEELFYVDKKWQPVDIAKYANNSFLFAKKTIHKLR